MSLGSDRSELECFVLGLVWQFGPVSAYGIRRRMRESPSRQWSASTGAIYPALRRLEEGGFVAGEALSQGQRRRREYRITPRGESQLRLWIGPPMGELVETVTLDPLRTRARFLRLLGAPERAAWVANALAALDRVEARIGAWDEANDHTDPFLAAITRHARLETESRRRWLTELAAWVGQDQPG
ncbi:MAG: PadR family transcriptional regulator [Phycisphaerales bacterium]|nr:PadR family transcriptional regulator [Phycisphaerales bacterium]